MYKTPLHDWHVDHGARMVDFAGWQMPILFTSITQEHHAVRGGAGLFDIAHMGRLWFHGPDAAGFLDHVLTNHVERMAPGQVRYSLVCNEAGGILDDVLIYRLGQEYLLVVNGANREKIVRWLDQHREGFDVTIRDQTHSSFMLALQGPEAEAILDPHVECDLTGIRYYRSVRSRAFGVEALVSRTGYTGEDGFELIVASEEAVDVWSKLAGAVPCGLGCRDTLRLEAGMPLYGHEMDETTDPFTAGLAFGVKLNKEEFIGKDALADAAGRNDLPRRVGLQLEGKRIAREGSELFREDGPIGRVTSGTFSPTLGASIAMGYVSPESAAPGTAVDVDVRGRRVPAAVVELPFYRSRG